MTPSIQLWRRLVPAYAAGYFLSYGLRSINAVIAPELMRDLGITSTGLGLLTSTYFLAFGLFQLPLGLLLDRFGPRRVEAALLLVAAGAFATQRALRVPALRYRFDAAWLELPVLGRLSRSYNAARFASTLAMLAAAGVPILKALQAASDTLSNEAMRADAQEALVAVREGAPLASALSQKKRFPGLLSMFARLGEQTGQLPAMLQRAAQQLSSEVQRRAMQLATVLEPLLIVVMGLVVMLIVLAVLLPIIQMNQLVK